MADEKTTTLLFDGVTLESVVRRLRELANGALPLPNTCSIAADMLEAKASACESLAYAVECDGRTIMRLKRENKWLNERLTKISSGDAG